MPRRFLSTLVGRRPPNAARWTGARFATQQRASPMRPYEAIMATERWSESSLAVAEALMANGWQLGSLPPVKLEAPLPWGDMDASRRSFSYHLHAWEPAGLLLAGYDHTGNDRFLRRAAGVALDWLEHHPHLDSGSQFAWYDMAIGLRACRLAYILDAAARRGDYDDAELERMIAGAELHREALADDARYAEHSNHGFYQAAGQLALGRRLAALPSMPEAAADATERLRRIVGRQFTGEGVHREHSPGYHLLVLRALARLVECDLLEDPEMRALVSRAEDAFAWFVQPDGHIVQIGDTDDRIPELADFGAPESEQLRFVLTRGAEGRPPEERLRAFPESGYVVMRDRWPRAGEDHADGSYLAQMCGFHSRTHKHADDLAFTWYDRGSAILVDAGRYAYVGKVDLTSELGQLGFWYGDPRRVYVESTRAHNTVEIDGRSHDRRARAPYGSALRGWGEQGDVLFSDTAVQHGDVEHRRLLLLAPRQWLVIVDALAGEPPGHDFTQRLHFDPALAVAPTADGQALAATGPPGTLHVVSLLGASPLTPVHGREEPDLLGWTSRVQHVLEPLWTSGFAATAATEHVFATLLAFGDRPPRPVPANRVERDASSAELAWEAADGTHRLGVARDEQGLKLGYRVD